MLTIVGLLIRCLIGSLIGAVILRAACALFNKWFGKEYNPTYDQTEFQSGSVPQISPSASDSPYAPPMAPLKKSVSTGGYTKGVPEPDFGKAFMICLSASVANMALGLVIGFAIGMMIGNQIEGLMTTVIAIQACMLFIGFFVLATATKLGLPTSFPRALGVSGLFMAIGLLVVIAIGAIVGVVMSVL